MGVDLTDTEYAMPGEIEAHLAGGAQARRDIPPLTGPEMAAMRLDSMEERLRLLEHRVAALERGPGQISSSYLYIPVAPGTVPAAPSHNHNETF